MLERARFVVIHQYGIVDQYKISLITVVINLKINGEEKVHLASGLIDCAIGKWGGGCGGEAPRSLMTLNQLANNIISVLQYYPVCNF